VKERSSIFSYVNGTQVLANSPSPHRIRSY